MALKKLVPTIVKAYFRSRSYYYKRIRELPVARSGAEGNTAFVELENGMKFYSHLSGKVQRSVYRNFFGSKVKAKLKPEAVNTAFDIVRRYYGPDDEQAIRNSGKYYDLKNGDIVIEAGAYIGFYAMRVAGIVGPEGKVFAIEAVPENFELLKKNIEANSISNIIPINKAVWKEKARIKFYREEKQIGSIEGQVIGTGNHIEAEADSLDNMMKEKGVDKVDFARVQLNGSEPEALEGMTELLKHSPKLMIAGMYKKNGVSVRHIVGRRLQETGYRTELCGKSVFAWKE